MATRSKRRRFRFSLKTLLVVFVVLSVGLGWFGWKLREAERQRRAVEAIEELGGWVRYDYEGLKGSAQLVGDDFFSNVIMVGFYPSAVFGDEDMTLLWELPDVTVLNLAHTQITDNGLQYLTKLTDLDHLVLWNTQVSDTGLQHLKGLQNLVILMLCGSPVTEEGINELQKALPDCEIIWDGETVLNQ